MCVDMDDLLRFPAGTLALFPAPSYGYLYPGAAAGHENRTRRVKMELAGRWFLCSIYIYFD